MREQTAAVGTDLYHAPEYGKKMYDSEKADVFTVTHLHTGTVVRANFDHWNAVGQGTRSWHPYPIACGLEVQACRHSHVCVCECVWVWVWVDTVPASRCLARIDAVGYTIRRLKT